VAKKGLFNRWYSGQKGLFHRWYSGQEGALQPVVQWPEGALPPVVQWKGIGSSTGGTVARHDSPTCSIDVKNACSMQ